MLRSSCLPSSSQFLISSFRFCRFSYSSFSSFSYVNRSSSSLFRRVFTKTLINRFSISHVFPLFDPAHSMQRIPWSQGKVMFSAGSSIGENKEKEILVHHLLVEEKDLKLLMELQQRIAGGEDLSDLAVEYSICPSKENGGMLGWVRRGQLSTVAEPIFEIWFCEELVIYRHDYDLEVSEFEKAAFSASLNKVVRCKSEFGWHLLEVLSEREGSILGEIGPLDLYSKLQDPNFIQEAQLIDVREHEEVAQASLQGFKVLPLRQFGTWGSVITDEFDPEKDTYVLCHHGVRSLQVAKWLQTQGFKRVFNVSGGIHSYSLNADPSVPTY